MSDLDEFISEVERSLRMEALLKRGEELNAITAKYRRGEDFRTALLDYRKKWYRADYHQQQTEKEH